MKKTIVDYKLSGKRVIIRSDLNVPIENGVITDDNRIKQSIETIKFAMDANAKVIILSHLGRIKTEEDKNNNSLQIVATKLSELMSREIKFISATRGSEVETVISNMQNGEAVMLENTRFEDLDGQKESSNDEELGKYWASLGDIFINDAFGTSHRAHASNVGIATYLPNGIGFLVKKETEYLMNAIAKPKKPLVVILGGAKVKDKIGVIKNMVNIADYILIGGGMCFTFIKALGYNIGSSISDDESIEFCKKIYHQYQNKIILPIDIVVGTAYTPATMTRLTDVKNINQNEIGMDIGVETINRFRKILLDAKTVIWNGPLGVFEIDKFAMGTRKICEVLASIRATTIIGGGDTATAVIKFGFKNKVSYISTGGGASLELLEGKALPGIEVINEK
ncbi:MAG: phosphoglycerate kinase [Bacilli bacterium]|nr:phosphoglycerate kinase [Bacilli bacterium]